MSGAPCSEFFFKNRRHLAEKIYILLLYFVSPNFTRVFTLLPVEDGDIIILKKAKEAENVTATVLAFNVRGGALAKLRVLCLNLKIRLNVVDEAYFGCRLCELAEGSAQKCENTDAPLEEPMLVMASFSKAQLNAFLQGLRLRKIPSISLKAVMTEHNAEWTALALYKELCAEREACKNGASAHHENADSARKDGN